MRTVLTLLCLCVSFNGLAQRMNTESPFKARNALYVEGLGSGGYYSINYERLFLTQPGSAYGFRVGTAYNGYGSAGKNLSLIGELVTVVGKGNHHGDFGIGITTIRIDYNEVYQPQRNWRAFAIPRLSYRYQKPAGGLMLRAGFTPALELTRTNVTNFSPWFGLAVGHSFKHIPQFTGWGRGQSDKYSRFMSELGLYFVNLGIYQ